MLSKVTCINNFFSVVHGQKNTGATVTFIHTSFTVYKRKDESHTIVSLSSQLPCGETIMVKVVIANSVCVFN